MQAVIIGNFAWARECRTAADNLSPAVAIKEDVFATGYGICYKALQTAYPAQWFMYAAPASDFNPKHKRNNIPSLVDSQKDHSLQNKLQKIGSYLASIFDKLRLLQRYREWSDINFFIDNTVSNAAFYKGDVYFRSELVELLLYEQLTVAISHELAHNMKNGTGVEPVDLLIDNLLDYIDNFLWGHTGLDDFNDPFRKDRLLLRQEFISDAIALKIVYHAGIGLKGASTFLPTAKRITDNLPEEKRRSIVNEFSYRHPPVYERIDRINQLINSMWVQGPVISEGVEEVQRVKKGMVRDHSRQKIMFTIDKHKEELINLKKNFEHKGNKASLCFKAYEFINQAI